MTKRSIPNMLKSVESLKSESRGKFLRIVVIASGMMIEGVMTTITVRDVVIFIVGWLSCSLRRKRQASKQRIFTQKICPGFSVSSSALPT